MESRDPLDDLRVALQTASSAKLEHLARCLLGSFLGVPFRIARSGDQRGGDGGVAGVGGRHLIFEARCYSDKTRLDERSIRGQIQQALQRNPSLEAWVLITTREVPEQVGDSINYDGLKHGIGTIIIDWLPQPLPKLAVLSACYPKCFEGVIGEGHDQLLADIAAMQGYDATLKTIRAELDIWAIGYESLRDASHSWVKEIWYSRRTSSARFGQNVAGGDVDARYVRQSDLIDCLDAWSGTASKEQVGAVVGRDGIGKTWIVIDWLQLRSESLPIIILVPSSSIGNMIANRSDLIKFIARYLYEIKQVRNEQFWEQRVRRLLERPVDEGPVFLLYFDGLNQLASFNWLGTFKQLQDEPFYLRTLVLITARTNFFDQNMHGLSSLFSAPYRIDVDGYDIASGRAFDQKLAMEGQSRDDFPEQLIPFASVPRLFDLVVQQKSVLGDVKEVTVHRLLWAYGASTVITSSHGTFTENSWRRFILDLAEEHRGGRFRSTVNNVTDLSSDKTLTSDHIYQRVSTVIDGIFSVLNDYDELDFHPDFVHHALGLALVKQMEEAGSDEDGRSCLEQFLDPIEGYDERAEILRAAVTITLQKGIEKNTEPQPTWLSTLCTFWIHTQNLPDNHLKELAILAPALVKPLLDVIEASEGYALSTPRYIAINALDQVDKSDQIFAREIAHRGTRWLHFISLEKRESDNEHNESSLYAMRRKRLSERIGTSNAGQVFVAGQAFEIVDYKDDGLIIAAAQLLQGRPLRDSIEFFKTGAIHTAIVGGGIVEETQSWLNILNTIDPEATAAGLRRASETIRSCVPEAGVHRDLNKRIASLLLWRTGYADDAERAWANDPKIDHWLRYETDYLPDPSRSIFPLERRHAAQVLRDTDLSIIRRIERARDALLDPNFEIPSEFVNELISTANGFDFTLTAVGRAHTREDLGWEHISLALARCAPEVLAKCERVRTQQYSERPSEQRYASALVAPSAMLLVREEESAAMKILRERENNGSKSDEITIQAMMLISEIQCEPPVEQIRRIMDAEIDIIYLHLAQACDTPSKREIDKLLDEYGGNDEQLNKLASLLAGHLAVHELTLSDQAFSTFSKLLILSESNTKPEAAWVLLGLNEPARLGADLDQTGWTWSSDKTYSENIMGSIAIAEANRGKAFTEYASRIAPAKLLEILSQEERSHDDVALAVDLLEDVLFGYTSDPPEPRVEISHEKNSVRSGRYEFTAGDLVEDTDNQVDVMRLIERLNNSEQLEEKRYQVIQTYRNEVRKVRKMGAQLYLVDIIAEDFEPILKHYPDAVDKWLDGLETHSSNFLKRIRLAEGFFVALCEALLNEDTPRGMSLWHVLRKCLNTNFISHANIDRLLHALFAAPPCAEVDATLDDIYDISEARTDEDLINLVIASRSSGRIDWLRQRVDLDRASSCPAHQQRAVFLEPLLTLPDIEAEANWPSGQASGVFDSIHRNAWILGQREAFAHHWLQEFVKSKTHEHTHAYWCLFKACSDRRVWVWKQNVCESYLTTNDCLNMSKQKFIEQEKHSLRRTIAKNEKSWSDKFAGRKFTRNLPPWNQRD